MLQLGDEPAPADRSESSHNPYRGLHIQVDVTHRAPRHLGALPLLNLDLPWTVSASALSERAFPDVTLGERKGCR